MKSKTFHVIALYLLTGNAAYKVATVNTNVLEFHILDHFHFYNLHQLTVFHWPEMSVPNSEGIKGRH